MLLYSKVPVNESAFLADESTDIAVKEQISVCVRFVEKGNNVKHYLREDFLSFVNVDDEVLGNPERSWSSLSSNESSRLQ